MNIYKTAVNKPITTIIVFATISIMGIFSLTRLGIDLFPDIESNAMMVMTTYQGASAEDIENNVSRPIENVLNSNTVSILTWQLMMFVINSTCCRRYPMVLIVRLSSNSRRI